MNKLKYCKPAYILFIGMVLTTAGGVFMGWMYFSSMKIDIWMVVLGYLGWMIGLGFLCEASSYKKETNGERKNE